MSQITFSIQGSGPGSGTVQSVSGGNNITITGTPTVNPVVNVSGTTNHALQIGNATGSLTSLAVGTNGQLPIGSAGANPVMATLTAGTGISISNGAGTITISSSGGTTAATFQAYVTSAMINATGDGTTAQIVFDTVQVNEGSNYNAGTGVFTAPVTGNYFFSASTQCQGVVAQTSAYMSLVATGYTAVANFLNPAAVTNATFVGLQVSSVIHMTAGDTCYAAVTYSGSTKTIIIGGNSFFSGFFVN
jgi:hypothetical protein